MEAQLIQRILKACDHTSKLFWLKALLINSHFVIAAFHMKLLFYAVCF